MERSPAPAASLASLTSMERSPAPAASLAVPLTSMERSPAPAASLAVPLTSMERSPAPAASFAVPLTEAGELAPATAFAVPLATGVPVADIVQPLHSAIGLTRWRLMWLAAYLLNVGALVAIWLLNMCAPLTLEWFELSGPIYAFSLSLDKLAVYKTEACCSLPLPFCSLALIHRIRPSRILGVDVYAERVFINVLLVGGGACCSSPIVIQTIDETSIRASRERAAEGLPDCERCATQPCLLRCTGAVRDEATRVSEFTRYFLGCRIVDHRSGLDMLRLSRAALRASTVAALFDARDRLRERLGAFQDVQAADC